MKPVLFIDFDGTLCHDRFWRSLPKDDYDKVQELLFTGDRTVIEKWMIGDLTSEEVNRLVADHLKKPFEEVWNSFMFDCKTMYVDQQVLKTIGKLRTRYTTILLTVNMDCFSRFTVPALQLENYFDEISNSYYSHKTKSDNDGEIYRELAEKHQARLSDCIAIDDSSSACHMFESLGGKAFLVTPDADVSVHLAQIEKF